ncbi:MAG: fumarylacetoacetase [Nocardioidaceae bacterium]|nr:fumarylacetoacetase [Nocardioidaceae bacterium]
MTWLALPGDCPYGLDTLPYGIFSAGAGDPQVGVRIGEHVLDLAGVAGATGYEYADVFAQPSLNPLMALGPTACRGVRNWARSLLSAESERETVSPHLLDISTVEMRLPIEVADYVDFYASESHACNVGQIFRPDSPGLPPSWKHLPIGYHGRAGTVVVSGTDVVRPRGQRRPGSDGMPLFGPSTKLDLECEVGFVVGQPSSPGHSIEVGQALDYIFGVVLLNDWSARDIQAWEYVPLGPFLGKSFATSISAWVLPIEALDAARLPLPRQVPAPLPYLSADGTSLFALDLRLEVTLNGQVISAPPYQEMYWSPAQMLAHMTVNGANLRVGDLFASGTVSGWKHDTFGSLLELTSDGTAPLELADGSARGFLEDGDVVTLTGWAPGPAGTRVTLGEVTGRVVGSTG